MVTELHVEIIGLAEQDEDGALFFSKEGVDRLRKRFREILLSPELLPPAEEGGEPIPAFAKGVDGFVRAVAALQGGGQTKAASQLMNLGAEVVEALKQENGAVGDRVAAAVTGATNLSRMKPVGAEPPPEGALKATAFIRPPPKQRG